MIKDIFIFFAISLALPSIANAAVYKCTVDGQAVFSDSPCGDDAKELDHKPAPAIGGRFDTGTDVELYEPEKRERASDRNSCPFINSTKLRRLIIKEKVVRGMKPAAVRKSWGSPTNINRGRTTQWAYHYQYRSSKYVYFTNGCVSNIN